MALTSFYNEIEPYPAAWLENLIARDLISSGIVAQRSVVDISPEDVRGFAQAHFFAGIGVWSYALRRAGWPDTRPVWTGSCPCQPFSVAGRGAGAADERHLWPEWFRLIRECRPPTIVGEQVGGRAGREWLDLVFADLERADYACGAINFPACSVGAPHIRQRTYFIARRLGDTRSSRSWGNTGSVPRTKAQGASKRGETRSFSHVTSTSGSTRGFWANADWLRCSDGKSRPVEPGTSPMVTGTSTGMGRSRAHRIKGYGNALCAEAAVAFVRAVMALPELDNLPDC